MTKDATTTGIPELREIPEAEGAVHKTFRSAELEEAGVALERISTANLRWKLRPVVATGTNKFAPLELGKARSHYSEEAEKLPKFRRR